MDRLTALSHLKMPDESLKIKTKQQLLTNKNQKDMSTRRVKALEAINAAKKETVNRQFSINELRELSRKYGYAGNNNFWQCFKMLLTREKRGVYTWKETKYPFNLAQLEHVLERANKYNKPKEETSKISEGTYKVSEVKIIKAVSPLEDEAKAIAFLKSKGYRIFKVVTYEEEV